MDKIGSMKKTAFFFLSLIVVAFTQAQEKASSGDKASYVSISGEFNFSSARIVSQSLQGGGSVEEGGDIMRFAPWFNMQVLKSWDRKKCGFFTGLTLRNIGFIYGKDQERWKARTYNIGVPVGLKWGNMKGTFIYLGYEFEVPFNYREKYLVSDKKQDKFNVWFSDRVSPFTHSGFFGINFKGGFNLKAKYYFTEFFNPKFDNSGITDAHDIRYPGNGLAVSDPNYIAPRRYLKVNVIYLALAWNMFKRPVEYYNYKKVEKVEQMY